GLARSLRTDNALQRAHSIDLSSVYRGDDVADLDACLTRRAVAAAELVHLGAANPVQSCRTGVRRIHLRDLDAEHRAANAAITQEVVQHLTSERDRNGKAVTGERARTRGDRVVDANHLTADVHQRTTRVAGVDRGVRLNE